jgi:hypothetical protein
MLSHTSDVLPSGRELSRLINAAVISPEFCRLLLTNPATALALGYHGDLFCLTSEERDLILSIHASSLADFACQITNHVQDTTARGISRPNLQPVREVA